MGIRYFPPLFHHFQTIDMSTLQRLPRPTVPGTYANLLVDVVARWGISPEQLLAGSGIEPEQMIGLLWHLDEATFAHLLKRALMLTGEPGLGFHLGLQMKISCHGLLGFAAMIAADIRAALDIAQQFVRIQSSTLSLRLEVEQKTAYFYFDYLPMPRGTDGVNPLSAYAFNEVMSIFLVLGFATMGEAVTGQRLTGGADVQFARPDYFDQFEHLLPGQLNFNQPQTRLIFPASYLDLPLIMADPVTTRIAHEQCKRSLHNLLGDRHISRLVRDLIYDDASGFRAAPIVAAKLNISERTLQRQLLAEGQSFRDMVDELRQQKAHALLQHPDLTLESIAETLSYTDVTSFSRAFKRWTGVSPGEYRKSHGA
jgi:AraC-like DNA-binding protein